MADVKVSALSAVTASSALTIMAIEGGVSKRVATNAANGLPYLDSGGKLPAALLPATVALLASPTFTGTVTIPTPTGGDNSTKAASTAFVVSYVTGLAYAPLASPTFTGVPAVPTAASGTNTTQAASTAYVKAEIPLVAAPLSLTINDQTGTTYTYVAGDANSLVRCSNASAITVTVPANSSVAFPVGTQILTSQAGAGRVTIAAAGGVTLNNSLSLSTRAQYSVLGLIKTATDTWNVFGDML